MLGIRGTVRDLPPTCRKPCATSDAAGALAGGPVSLCGRDAWPGVLSYFVNV